MCEGEKDGLHFLTKKLNFDCFVSIFHIPFCKNIIIMMLQYIVYNYTISYFFYIEIFSGYFHLTSDATYKYNSDLILILQV